MARSYPNAEFAAEVCIQNGELKIGPGKEERFPFHCSTRMVIPAFKKKILIEPNKNACVPAT